jgi:hypothetical protein
MWVRVWLAGACLAGLLTACAVIDPVDSRYDTVSRSLAKARNESIFLNLIRASHDYPLSFVTVANVTPTMTNTSSLGLPSFLFGPAAGFGTAAGSIASLPTSSPGRDVIFGNGTASNSTAVSTNFNVSTQETSAFYEGFLKPVDLQILDYFIRQGYPRELLFWLFTDSVEINLGDRLLGLRYDPPNDYGCDPLDKRHRCFRGFVVIAIAAGLTVEQKTLLKASSGASNASKDGGGGGGKTQATIFARFCFDRVLARRAQAQMGQAWLDAQKELNASDTAFSPQCGSPWDPVKEALKPQGDTFNFSVGSYKFKIVPRSAYGVFEFLGSLIKVERDKPQPAPDQADVPARALEPPTLLTVSDDRRLVTVVRDNTGYCFVRTWFFDGDYCVPESATTTKRIFSLLAQLIAIQTAASDLSITPVVRVIQ